MGLATQRGLKSNEISFLSKMVAIIDFFDAVTTKRSYHEPLPVKDALSLMYKSVGKKLMALFLMSLGAPFLF